MYTESLEKLLARARGDKRNDIGPMGIVDLVELAYKSGAHDKFYAAEEWMMNHSHHVYDCDYLKPIEPGSIALPCSCGLDETLAKIQE